MDTHPLWRPLTPRANADRQTHRVAARQTRPGPLQPHAGVWDDHYELVAGVVAATVPDQVVGLRHVGSTAVPGLIAKPVIDIDLTVPDALEESAYLPRLEVVGFCLIFRDVLGGDPHRQLTFAEPNANLHVWSPDAIEPRRHAAFVDWLRDHAEDRELYGKAKLAAAEAGAGQTYNDAKSAIVYDIYERIFAADPDHPHDPRPRRVP